MKKYLKALIVSITLLISLLLPSITYAATASSTVCQGVGVISGTNTCDTRSKSTVNNVVKLVINIFSVIVGILALIMLILGGLKYITSGGSPDKTNSAKNTILYAVIGLFVAVLAQIIVLFVLSKTNTL
jgi:cytochrome bd-type quinol oxidase subunit 2